MRVLVLARLTSPQTCALPSGLHGNLSSSFCLSDARAVMDIGVITTPLRTPLEAMDVVCLVLLIRAVLVMLPRRSRVPVTPPQHPCTPQFKSVS